MTDPSAMAAEAAAHHLLNDPVADPSDAGQHHRPPAEARTDDASTFSHLAPSILTFSDVSDDISQLGPLAPGPDGDNYSNNNSNLHYYHHHHPPHLDNIGSRGGGGGGGDGGGGGSSSSSSSSSSSNGGTNNDNYHLHQHRTHNNPNAASLPLAQPTSHHHHPRKPSPGLAARLKALGIGSVQRQLSPSPSTTVGRLPEDQLRLIDQKHQANSASAEAIERRGRPWKGPSAPLQLLRSKSSRGSLLSRREPGDNDGLFDTTEPTSPQSCVGEPPLAHARTLPFAAAPASPLDMDAHKYRLPDHTNDNGTKTLCDTRHKHLERDTTPTPPPPPPKDTPPEATETASFNPDAISYFNPLRLQRAGSIYTISRLSFANQLAQLTSLQLPDAASLSGKISAIPTAQSAAQALINAAEQIRMWIYKASEVIDGLDSDDDVEWAAAGGREGYDEVENAISRFEDLINVYVSAIEELQGRRDIVQVSSDDLQLAVTQMESILEEWAKIRTTLKTAKSQVEIAMEWEELWNSVLGDIENEMEDLTRLVFEMEERRHKSLMAATSGDGVDIGDLETIVEETPSKSRNSRVGGPVFPLSPTSPAAPNMAQDDSSLLALFARMQPLRASLDFLPMRLSVFEARASHAFPTACEELGERRTSLEASYKKLEKDAESVRKELGEDKWILVFRSAGRQAHKMIESVERSVAKLREAVDSGMHLTNPPIMAKKIESYEAKKMHYGPAIERVLSIIERGVKDRLTLNGEILRLHTEMQSSWEQVKGQMQDLDVALDEMQQSDRKGEALRDSIYSLLSNDRSTVTSGRETPGSSPPSSVVMSSLGLPVTPSGNKKSRSSSNASSHRAPPTSARRSGLMPPSQISRRPVASSRMSTLSPPSTLSTPPRSASTTPSGSRMPWSGSHHQNQPDTRPRWNSSVNTRDSDVGHNFKPLTLTTPSPYSRPASSLATPARPASSLLPHFSNSKIPTLRTPSGRAGSASPVPDYTPARSSGSRMSFRDRISSPGPYAQQPLAKPRLTPQPPPSAFANRRASMHQPMLLDPHSPPETRRAASSMATSRRASLLPQPTGRRTTDSAMGGRTTPQPPTSTSRLGLRKPTSAAESEHWNGSKPRWRH